MKIAFYQPEIAGNIGTAIRLAACTGVNIDIIEPCGFFWNDARMKRASMDYIKYTNITRYHSFKEYIESKKEQRIILLSSHAETEYTSIQYRKNDILLAGRESCGITKEDATMCSLSVSIKMQNNTRSLNVTTSMAIVLSEALRQLSCEEKKF